MYRQSLKGRQTDMHPPIENQAGWQIAEEASKAYDIGLTWVDNYPFFTGSLDLSVGLQLYCMQLLQEIPLILITYIAMHS